MGKLLIRIVWCCCLVACSDDADGSAAGADGGLVPTAGLARLGSAGGELQSPDGKASVEVPRGALSKAVVLSVGEVSEALAPLPDGLAMASRPQAFRPHGTGFEAPVRITLAFESSKLGKQVLRLDDERDSSWEVLGDVQFERGYVTFEVDGFSIFVVAHPEDGAALDCTPPQTACDGRCVNTARNEQHCGACRIRCAGSEVCMDSVCRFSGDGGPAPECVTDGDCSDARFCNGAEACQSGVCVAGAAPDCDDSDPGTVDSCDPATDACRNQDLDDAGAY